MTTLRWRRLAGFISIGGFGFVVEAVIISVAGSPWWGVPATSARLVSFPCAVAITWWLNRKLYFRSEDSPIAEGARYFATQVAGALANLGVFALCIFTFPLLVAWPVVALGFGACAGLAVNFVLASVYVFNRRKMRDGKST